MLDYIENIGKKQKTLLPSSVRRQNSKIASQLRDYISQNINILEQRNIEPCIIQEKTYTIQNGNLFCDTTLLNIKTYPIASLNYVISVLDNMFKQNNLIMTTNPVDLSQLSYTHSKNESTESTDDSLQEELSPQPNRSIESHIPIKTLKERSIDIPQNNILFKENNLLVTEDNQGLLFKYDSIKDKIYNTIKSKMDDINKVFLNPHSIEYKNTLRSLSIVIKPFKIFDKECPSIEPTITISMLYNNEHIKNILRDNISDVHKINILELCKDFVWILKLKDFNIVDTIYSMGDPNLDNLYKLSYLQSNALLLLVALNQKGIYLFTQGFKV